MSVWYPSAWLITPFLQSLIHSPEPTFHQVSYMIAFSLGVMQERGLGIAPERGTATSSTSGTPCAAQNNVMLVHVSTAKAFWEPAAPWILQDSWRKTFDRGM